jgi:hypothetical protein
VIGMSEHSYSILVIVSEERGEIAVAVDGQLHSMADEMELRKYLDRELRDPGEILRRRRLRRRGRRIADAEQKEALTK